MATAGHGDLQLWFEKLPALCFQNVPDTLVFGAENPDRKPSQLLLLCEIELRLESARIFEEHPFVDSADAVGRERDLLYRVPLDRRTVSFREG